MLQADRIRQFALDPTRWASPSDDCGRRYREFLIEPLERLGITVLVPMAHLTRGEQLGWVTEMRMSRLADLERF